MGSSPLKLAAALVATAAVALSSADAHARGPLGFEIGAEVGYATSPSGAAVNPLGLGLGGRAGLRVWGLYAGVNVIDYLGSSDGNGNGGQYHALQLGGEIGYGFTISSVTIRPKVGVGEAYLSGSVAGLTSPAIPTAFCLYAEPGVLGSVSVGRIYVGVDAGALFLTNEPTYALSGSQYLLSTSLGVAFAANAQIGLRF